jgi:hypothetical protein
MKARARINPPTSLHARAVAWADEEHARRLAELRELAPLMDRLDELAPALKARGIELHLYVSDWSIKLDHYQPTGYFGKRLKVLRLNTRGLLSSDERPRKWLQALTELGFTEIERSGSVYPTALLRKGHLLLRVDAPDMAPTAKEPTGSAT